VTIVNLTGHRLLLGPSDTRQVSFASEGRVRLDGRYEEVDKLELDDGIVVPLLGMRNGVAQSLPRTKKNVLYVVSGLVANRVKRPDVVAPARLHKVGGRTEYARALLRYTK
jgi:hypothetical protein